MRMTISLDLKPLKAMQKKLKTLETTSVEVGFFPEDQYGPENNNLPVAAVALMQERGAMEYPSRPFFTKTVEDRMVWFHLSKALAETVRGFFKDGRTLTVGLKKAGNILKDELEVAIDDYPGSNSISWANYKGFNDPLIYTGKMLNSVKVKIKK